MTTEALKAALIEQLRNALKNERALRLACESVAAEALAKHPGNPGEAFGDLLGLLDSSRRNMLEAQTTTALDNVDAQPLQRFVDDARRYRALRRLMTYKAKRIMPGQPDRMHLWSIADPGMNTTLDAMADALRGEVGTGAGT